MSVEDIAARVPSSTAPAPRAHTRTMTIIAIACLGAGQWSIDDKIDFVLHDWWGLVWALVIGVGGTVLLLATFWRPPAPKPAAT